MGRIARMGWVAAVLVAMAPAAMAQDALRMQVTSRTDSGGASPTCLMEFRLTNGGTARISTFSAEIRAVHAQTGAELRVPVSTIPFVGVQPGETKEWTIGAVTGARCEQVRLEVLRMTCVRRCGPASWTHQGLAAVEVAQR
jgi:hypothetical protein